MRKLLVVLVLAAGAVVAAKRLGRREPVWHAAGGPTPGTPEPAHDQAGATPGEALSDLVEEPHVATTPDAPAETVTLDPE